MTSKTLAQDMNDYASNPGSRMLNAAALFAGGLALITSVECPDTRYEGLACYATPTRQEREIFESMGPPATYEEAIDNARNDYLAEAGYTSEECRKCSLMDDPELMEAARNFGNDPVTVMGMADTESRVRQHVNGKPIRSKSGAYGILQLKREAAEEVWIMFNEDRPRHRRFKERFDLQKYKHLFEGDENLAWSYVKHDRKTNWVAGNVYHSYNKFIENGNVKEALRNYNGGRDGKRGLKKETNDYLKEVRKRRDFFRDCEKRLDKFRGYQAHLVSRNSVR